MFKTLKIAAAPRVEMLRSLPVDGLKNSLTQRDDQENRRRETATMLTPVLLGSYRRCEASDPEIYSRAIEHVLAHYDPHIQEKVTDSYHGLPSKSPFPPNPFFPQLDSRFVRWPLANDRVRFVGEPIVAIVAANRYLGADAAELVVIDYEPLPVVMDMDASATNEILLFPDLGTNIGAQLDLPAIDGLFDGADVVVEQRMVNRRMAPAPMEGRVAAATWDGTRLTLYASTQGVSATRDGIVGIFGLDKDAVRVVAADVGGGFGAKGGLSSEEIIVLWATMRLGGTLRWAETRTENLLAMGHGRGQVQTVKIGATNDGQVVGMHMDIAQEAGAYPDVGAGLPVMTMMMASGVYRFPRIAYTSRSYVTNTTPTGAFRGAGRPEAAYAIERILDVLAAKLGLDPVELRRRNFIFNDAFPVTTSVGTVYDSGNYGGALDRALASADYRALRAEQQRRRDENARVQLGIGVSCYVEITGVMPGLEPARIVITGVGLTAPNGNTLAEFRGNLLHGVAGIERIDVGI